MAWNPASRSLPLAVLFLAAFVLASCSPRQQRALPQGFYDSSLSGFAIAVNPPMTLAAAGVLHASVPSDVVLEAYSRVSYGLFLDAEADKTAGQVARTIHTLSVELPLRIWRWEMETWAKPESLSYEKRTTKRNYWTAQIFPVVSAGDWFVELLRANGRDIPEFWLAKRWSATPETESRVVAEYREPAPLCLQSRLHEAAETATDKKNPLLPGRELRRECDAEILAFSRRAEAALSLDMPHDMPPGPAPRPEQAVGLVLPRMAPALGKLAGKAEHVDWSDGSETQSGR